MGASGWEYYVPYQEDVAAALEELQARILRDEAPHWPGEHPRVGAVRPVQPDEACRLTGTDVLTREHVEAIEPLAGEGWSGRVAVLHDGAGRPSELYFWGISGD